MQVAHLDAVLGKVVGQILGHALGQRGDQDAFPCSDPCVYFRQQIVHLGSCGPHFELRINQPGRAHQLLDHLCLMLALIVSRGR